MLQAHSALRGLFPKYVGFVALAAAGLLVTGTASWAAGKKSEPAVHLLSSVQVPVTDGNTTNGMYSFDISSVDQSTGVYFLADRSNLAVESLSSEFDPDTDQAEQRPRAFRRLYTVRARRWSRGQRLRRPQRDRSGFSLAFCDRCSKPRAQF